MNLCTEYEEHIFYIRVENSLSRWFFSARERQRECIKLQDGLMQCTRGISLYIFTFTFHFFVFFFCFQTSSFSYSNFIHVSISFSVFKLLFFLEREGLYFIRGFILIHFVFDRWLPDVDYQKGEKKKNATKFFFFCLYFFRLVLKRMRTNSETLCIFGIVLSLQCLRIFLLYSLLMEEISNFAQK